MTLARTSSGWHAVAGFMVTMRDRLRWSLAVLTAVIGLTVYAAAADLVISLLVTVSIGLTSFGATALLLLRRPGGSGLAAVAAAALIAVQFVDLGATPVPWLTAYYLAAGGLVIILAVAHALAVRWGAPRPFARTR